MELIIIAAIAANRVIGRHHTMPWHIAEDMAHFKATTMGHPLIMGRHTYDTIGGPLPGRRCIVVSRTAAFQPHPTCTKVESFQEALSLCIDAAKVFVIGGGQLYQAALPLADTLLLSWLDWEVDGDVFFPAFDHLNFVLVDSQPLAPGVTLSTYLRTGKPAQPVDN